MTNPDCIFCQIIAGQIPSQKVYEDNEFVAILDIKPVSPGHTLLIPKTHCTDLFECPDELLATAGPVIKKLAAQLKAERRADGLNLAMNNGSAAGQIVPHAHIHLIPRFTGDALKLTP